MITSTRTSGSRTVGELGWKHRESDAIRWIKSATESYYVSKGGHTVRVIIAVQGREYLKTEADGYSPDNLLALPECP